MKLTIPRDILSNALSEVALASSAKTAMSMPSASCVLIKCSPKNGNISITADNGSIRMESTVDCIHEEQLDDVVLVSFNKLSTLLSRGDIETVHMESAEKGVKVSMGSLSATVQSLPVEEYPAARKAEQRATILLNGKDLAKAVALCAACAGDGKQFDWNSGVHIVDDGETMFMEATDGKQFCRVKLPSSGEKLNTLLPARTMRALSKSFEVTESVMAYVFDSSVTFVCDSVEVNISCINSVFGNVEETAKMIEAENTESVVVNRERLITVFHTATSMLDADDFGIGFEFDADHMKVSAQGTLSGNKFSELVDIAHTKPALLPLTHINGNAVANFLRNLDCDDVSLFYVPLGIRALTIKPAKDDSVSWSCALVRK